MRRQDVLVTRNPNPTNTPRARPADCNYLRGWGETVERLGLKPQTDSRVFYTGVRWRLGVSLWARCLSASGAAGVFGFASCRSVKSSRS